MGATSSSLSELHKNENLLKFTGKESISYNDPFWNQLLSFTFSPPKSCSDGQLLEESVRSLLESLLINNLHTGNLGSLFRVFLSRAVELKASAQCENSIFTWQTFNALFILRCVIKYFVQTVSEEGLIKHLAVKSAASPEAEHGNLLELLITTLVEIIVDVPVLDFTYAVHLEALNTLLVLLSTQMFSMRPPTKSNVYRCLMHGKSSIHSFLLTKTLLQHFIKQEKPPKTLHDSGGSIILGLASGIWNVLTFGYGQRGANDTAEKAEKEMTLARQSLLMLLVLVNHCTSDRVLPNPYREALFSFGNIQDPSSTQCDAIPAFKLDYSKLFESICSTLNDDHTTLLLYLLIHRNIFFKNYILSRTDSEALVVPILKILYHAQERSSHLIYMTLIILLILSEDDLYNESVHNIMLKNIAWYTERMISEISLGGLLVLVVIRTIQYNMTRTRDKYLHTNCLAALANMSSHFKNLHPYVCQRFVSLFENLAKRLTKVLDQLRNNGGDATKSDSDEDFSTDLMYDLSVLEEVLRMVLEILNCTLSMQLQHNPNLLYTLLYKRHVFEAFKTHPNFQDIIQNIDMVLGYFSSHLEAANKNLSVGEVSSTIQQAALQWPQDRLRKFPELKFKYVEEEQPEEFFIPYIWSLVYNVSGIYWNPQNIILFNPLKRLGS